METLYVFRNPSLANVPFQYPMKTVVNFKRAIEMEYWLEIG